MSISTHNSPVEKKIISPENTKLKTKTEKEFWLVRITQPICALKKDEEGQEKHQDPTILGHGMLIGIQLLLVGGLYVFFNIYGGDKANIWMKELEIFNSNKTTETVLTQESNINQKKDQTTSTEKNSNKTITKAEQNRIVQQFDETKTQAKIHYDIMKDLSQKRYVAMSMALVLSSISCLCLILISRLGWEKVHKGIINIFLITTTFAIFYGDITNVYQHEKNIALNEFEYKEYINLGNYILSYLVTENDTKGEERSPEEFIYQVDSRMEQLNDIGLVFDNASIDKKLEEISSVMSGSEQQKPEKTDETE